MTSVTRTSPSIPAVPTSSATTLDNAPLDGTTDVDSSPPSFDSVGVEDAATQTSYGTDSFVTSGPSAPISSSAPPLDPPTSRPAPSLDDVRSAASMLRLGMNGLAVAELQSRLNYAGAHPPLAVDGDFGPATEKALMKFQAENLGNGVRKTGALDQATLNALEQSRGQVDAFPELPDATSVPSASETGAAAPLPLLGAVKPSELADTIADKAEALATARNEYNNCASGVYRALAAAEVNVGAGDAFQKAPELAGDSRFTEVTATNDELPKLPKGSLVVWGKNEKLGLKYGHVSIALGDGREASDHVGRQMTGNGPGKGDTSDYGAGVTGQKFRVFIPTGE